MAAQSFQLYLERLQGDEMLRQVRRTLLPVTLTPAIRALDGSGYRPQGEALDVDTFLHYFRAKDEPGSLVRHTAAVVVAPVGAGKSTLLKALMWELTQRAVQDSSAPIPFYLPLERLGETAETLLMNALWRIGLPVARQALRAMVDESTRSLFVLLDPTPSFAATNSADKLDEIIRDLETLWPGCRWIVAMRPDAALSLPSSWHDRRFYLLDPLPPEQALALLVDGLERPLQALLGELVEQVRPLATLIRRPLFAETLRGVAQQSPSSDGKRWVQDLLLSVVERGGGLELPRALMLEVLEKVATQSEASQLGSEARRTASKSLPRLREAGLIDQLPVVNGSGPRLRFADPALHELLLWLGGSNGTVPTQASKASKEMALSPEVTYRPPTPASFLTEWEEAIASQELTDLLQLQTQLDQMRAETLHQIALTHRSASRLGEAETHVCQALALRPGHAPYRVTLGTITSLAGEHEEAHRILEEALAHAPTGTGYFYLGQSYQALGWQQEAFQAFQQAAEMDSPQQAEAAASAARLASEVDTRVRYWEQALAFQPARADWHVQLGLLYEESGEQDAAQQCYQRALEANPNEADAHYHLGTLLLEAGEKQLALKHLQRATAARPKEARWLVELGRALEANGEATAENAYRHAIRIEPQMALPFAALGSYLRRAGSLDEAHAALKQSLALDGEQVDVLFELGLLNEERGDVVQALAAYRRAARLDQASPQIRSHIGAVHRRLNQVKEARHWLEEALNLNPHFGPAYDELGQVAESEGEWEEAIRHYRAALREMPDDIQLRFRTAVMYLRLEQPAEAVPLLEDTSRAMPSNAEVQWYLAEALRLEGRSVEALAAYRTTTRLAPDNVEYHLALARHAHSMNRLDEAQRIIERAIELDGEEVEAHRLAAELALDRYEPVKALAALRRAIDLAPHDETLYQRIGVIYQERGQLVEALDYLNQALELAGESAPLLVQIATIHEQRGDLPAAIAFLDRALKVEPQAIPHRLQRARLLATTGEPGRARRDWEIVLRVNAACGEAHFGLGQLFLADEHKESALLAFERAIVGDGIPAEWLLAHGQLAAELGQAAAAQNSLNRLLDNDDASVPVKVRAQAHHTLARLSTGNEAQEHVQQAISLVPHDATYYVTLAQLQDDAGLPESALESLEAAHALSPHNPTILSALAEHHEARGNIWDAIECYRRAAEAAVEPARLLRHVARLQQVSDWREASATLQEAIAIEPEHAPAHRELGALLWEAGQLEQAEESLRHALDLDHDDVQTLCLLGEVLVNEKRDEEAQTFLYRAAELAPDQDRIHFLLGFIAARAEQDDVALMEFQQATSLDPNNAEYQRHLGQAFMTLGRLTEARHALERALDLNREDAESHFLLGSLSLKQGETERAAVSFRDAVSYDPTRAVYRRSLGETWLAQEQWDAALSALRAARELDAGDPHTHYLMAKCYTQMERLDQALERAENAVSLAPDEPGYMRLLGDLHAQRHEWDAAVPMYERVLQHQPEDSMLYVALGRCERERHLLDAATDWFRQAIEQEPQLAIAHHLLAQTIVDRLHPFFLAELVQAPFPPADPMVQETLLQEALDTARRACALEPRNPTFQTTLAQALLLTNQAEAALSTLREVQEVPEQRGFYLMLAGLATLRRGDGARAR
ncbi:MAG: tetratricopeptide repeat protein, partial [Chloroflexota bacterium]|nr:tetratricopeptide repeat protein [Chloroflexota bacterium]